jgi:dipeptidyl aminopeptidase/acylaminoacyl peptidase
MHRSLVLVFAFACATAQKPSAPQSPPVPLKQFFDTRRLGAAVVSGDEKLVAFNSDAGGRIDIWVAPIEGGPARQLTHVQGFVGGYQFSPAGRTLAYLSDVGGTELMHLFLLDADGGAPRDLTADLPPGARAELAEWSQDGKTLLYLTSARDEKYLDLYELDPASGKSERLWESSGNQSFAGTDHQHRRFVAAETLSDSNDNLYLIERGKAGAKLLTPHQGDVLYSPAGFSRDGRTLYLTSDRGGEFQSLYALDVETLAMKPVLQPAWDVDDAGTSMDGRLLYAVINEDGTPRIWIRDEETHREIAVPKAPSGGFAPTAFSRSGRYLGAVLRTDTTPAVPYVLDLQEGKAIQLADALPAPLRALGIKSAEAVRIQTFDGREVPAFLYRARTASPAGAVIWVHGGPTGQSRRNFMLFPQYLLTKGYDVLVPNVRGSTGYGKTWTRLNNHDIGGGPLKDVVACKRWLVAQAGVPADKVVVLGGSYGGYMTLAAEAFAPEEFAANVDYFGVSDLKTLVESFPPYWTAGASEIYVKFGDPKNPADAQYQHDQSPLFFADRMVRPLLVVQGDKDARVKKDQSDRIVDSLKKRGVPVHYLVLENEGHGFSRNESYQAAFEATDRFLDRYLLGDTAAAVLPGEVR